MYSIFSPIKILLVADKRLTDFLGAKKTCIYWKMIRFFINGIAF